jgi:excisionase family DNA binding protein
MRMGREPKIRLKERKNVERLKRLLTIEDVAEVLAVPIGTVNDWRHKGTGPKAIRVGKHVRYRQTDLEAWLDQKAEQGSPAA